MKFIEQHEADIIRHNVNNCGVSMHYLKVMLAYIDGPSYDITREVEAGMEYFTTELGMNEAQILYMLDFYRAGKI